MSRPRGVALSDDAMDLDLIALSSVNVMVTAGAAGEQVAWARAIHERVQRSGGPFVAVCPALNRPIRAADVDEWFARAARGTLFIDDIGQLDRDAQLRLSSLLMISLNNLWWPRPSSGSPGRPTSSRRWRPSVRIGRPGPP